MLRFWALLWATLPALAPAQTLSGRWDGTVVFHNMKIPFSMQMEVAGDTAKGSFFKGEDRVASTSGSFIGGTLRLAFSQYGTVLEAKLLDGVLKGTYGSAQYGMHSLEASAYCTCAYEGEAGPDISGAWEAPGSEKLQLAIRRKGEDTFADIAQANGASGPHTGRFDGLQFTLNHFDGSQPSVLELAPLKDGSLEVVWKQPGVAARKYRAVRGARTINP